MTNDAYKRAEQEVADRISRCGIDLVKQGLMGMFFVVTLHRDKKRSRTWGFYERLEDAERCVYENWADIYERGYYDLALIEEMSEGLCPFSKYSRWYAVKYNGPELDTYTVEPIICPPQFEHLCNFSIG